MLSGAINSTKPNKINNKYVTSEFIGYMKYLILNELFSVKQEYSRKYGELVICLDDGSKGYWRREVYAPYKCSRKKSREESDVDFKEVFDEINKLIDQIKVNLPWKTILVNKAEADDIILVLSREFCNSENVLIYSPDKDFIQSQRNNITVQQYSPLTRKWITPENKNENMDDWLLEHICLGDAADEVPRVVDHTEFSDNFISYLKENNVSELTPYEFKNGNITKDQKVQLLSSFEIYKTNRKGESTGEKDVYKDIRFGPSVLKKQIKEFGSLDKWLDSHPLYREHYDRNFVLVMEEGIPSDIWNEIIIAYKEAQTDYNDKEFENYLIQNNLQSIVIQLPNVFKISRQLTADDFDW